MERILVAVDDSPAGLAAGREAIGLAARLGAALRFVHVTADSYVTKALQESGSADLPERRGAAAAALFRHLRGLAGASGVEAYEVELSGDPAQKVLQEARAWPADLIVIGRGPEHGVGGPYVGHAVRMVLEFADQPVLVVPATESYGPLTR